ncbi:uncharacterized CRM domain-containing protein At3g25440, chloroplastic isoform X1 [Dendrobium catenatum]|uniref:uncharacterized CRM domain-containing protein At3g25440, chloroplastic isoform X1 n=2 Tax=Dendrobium catenatum TaxID=906689 RepID=UPI0009F7014D|nr:uncharacterized CRM domain-containing protein At3g25440, chloroplastic isoform X1 [Dendrobium catenatum]XP_020678555.1 uncharacterized CRM domain-containing protein At3g25440, chloroplastic isoform X1 [Dendrobium catenatum]XP_020678556.1 uncharacterized CRM domain-containing protein At3g25440, chloroplastic isoform X1 [Dendrobium catenatum]XP_020678557.1 uncharacterized CRM domain-containing protein At3g25440, chloroplastic isoform X1 [Dendrobium catenatum]XP_020678558.1 uncharacterized CRM 
MGSCYIFAQSLKRRLDNLLSLNPTTSCYSSLRASPTNLKDCNFFNLYEYHLAIRNFSCDSLMSSVFAENRNIQKHIRPFRIASNLGGGRLMGYCNLHTTHQLGTTGQNVVENDSMISAVPDAANDVPKYKRKKLKGKRAVVRWLKFFRWKKKKEYERMTSEEKILFKLRKARKKEGHLVEALQKIEPKDSSVTMHDPEVLTPEEHFYLVKLGQKCKNYVPVGRRGIFQGVILNMHLHWKKHQTLKVIVKTFTPEEVREIAAELARLSGGIVLEISEDNTIIMYRGKNYSQPPTEIMSPKITLTRKKALDKSKYRDALHAVRRYIPKLEQDLDDVHIGMKRDKEYKPKLTNREENSVADIKRKFSELGEGSKEDRISIESELGSITSDEEDESSMESSAISESENLSDIFETDSDAGAEEKENSRPRHLYLDGIDRFPSEDDGSTEDFQEHLRRISAAAKRGGFEQKDLNIAELDEIDKIFLRADALLKKKR